MLETLLSFDPAVLAAFILAGLLLNITPGADFLFVSTSGIRGGPQVGRAAALGINCGILVHLTLAAAGVSALLAAYPVAFDAIRYLGAGYLVFMAYKAWTADPPTDDAEPALTTGAAIRRGFLVNVLNPKTGLFIFAFIPQFADPEIGPIWHQIVLLGLIFMINGLLFSLALGTVAGHLRTALRGHIQILNRLTAILFGGLAARLALQ